MCFLLELEIFPCFSLKIQLRIGIFEVFEMTSIRDIIVDKLSTLESNLTSVRALDELPRGSERNIYCGLKKQIQEILINFTFLLPLSDLLQKWIVTKDKKLRSLVDQIQATIEEAAKIVNPEDVDDVWQEICEMTKEGEPQAVQDTPFFWVRRRINTPRNASKLFDVLSQVNAKIHLLKPKIEKLCCMNLLCHPHISPTLSCKEFGFWWLVSTACSCLSRIDLESIGRGNRLKVLKLMRNLLDLQIFHDGLSNIPGVNHVANKVAFVATYALLLACRWWVRVYQGFSVTFDVDFNDRLLHLCQMISAVDPETLAQVLRPLKSLKTVDHSLFSEKVTQFTKYILPHLIGLEEFATEIESSTIIVSTQVQMEPPKVVQSIPVFPPQFKELMVQTEKSFLSWLPEHEPLIMGMIANVYLMRVEGVFIQRIRHRGRFTHLSKIFGKWNLQYSSKWPEESTENRDQIVKFLEEVDLLQGIPDLCFPRLEAVLECLVLLKVQIFKLKRELESYEGNSKFSLKDKVQSFQDWLEFLINCFVRYKENTEQYKDACRKYEVEIESIVEMVVPSCNSLLNHIHISDEMVQSVDNTYSSLLNDIKNIMTGIAEELCIPVRMSNLPETNALGFYGILLGKVDELMNCKASLFISFKQYMEELLVHLHFFRNFLGNYLGPKRETQELRDLYVHVVHVAYKAEYLIDTIVLSDISQWQISICLYNLLLNTRHIKGQVSEIIAKKKTYDVKVHNSPLSLRRKVKIEDTVLSLNDEENLIIDRLVGGSRQRDIVSIVGMPGIGKTTLAKKVYSSCTVVHHFHIRAWCCVGEVYRKRELLLEILSHIIVLTENILGKSGEDLEFKLRQLLLKQKYLIVIDDVWSTEAWNDLQTSLPENENGSRILLTSRSEHVNLKAEAHYLRLLSDAESWALLQMKIFDGESCPNELIEVGQEIAKKCKGLALAVVAMAGILKRTDKLENLWMDVAKDLISQVVDDPHEQCRYILELSYKFLPENLKACFLYFGAFPEDQEIMVTKLIRLWIAEGLIEKTELKSLEELAEDYLKDLIGRSLIIFAQPRSRGGPKACRVHDMLRYFCWLKAKEDNFLRLITMSNDSSWSPDDLYFLVNDNFSNPSSHQTYEDYRLCFYSKRNHFIQSRPSGILAHSLLFFPINDKYARSSYDISFIFSNFRRLKVLDLELINIGPSFPIGLELMVWLKYLAVSGDVQSVPSSINKLSNLETFVLKGLKGKVDLPDTIWDLKRLRHVQVTDVAIMSLNRTRLSFHGSGNSCLLDCLVTLSTLFIPNRDDAISMLKVFPNLRKLGCIFSESLDHFGSYNLFPRLDVLTRLESLKISYTGRALSAAEFIFPLSLKKLTLSNFRLPWSHISMIGRLQNLEVLKLLSNAYDGEIWDMVEGEFHNLKFLKLENLNVSKWNACSDNLPNLEKLQLRNCKQLEEVPSSFVEICTLKMIEVKWCGQSAEDSVRRMRDEADEFLNIIITSDFELSL